MVQVEQQQSGQKVALMVQEYDWAASPFGDRSAWPNALTTIVDVVLSMKLPAFVAWGQDFRIIYNDAFAATLGPSHPNALGSSVAQLWEHEWPTIEPIFRRAMNGEPIFFEDAAFRVRRGTAEEIRYFTFSQTPLRVDPGAAPSGIFAISIDTTEDVRNRQRLSWESRNLPEVIGNGMGFIGLTLGPDHRFEFINDTYLGMIGGRQVVGRTVREALPELAPQGFIAILDEVYATGEPFTGREIPIRLADAEGHLKQRIVNIAIKGFRNADGEVIGIFAEGSDVTEQKSAEENIATRQQGLFHASRVAAMGTMAKTLAHELNQPLTAAANYLSGSRSLLASIAGEKKNVLERGLEDARQQIIRAGDIIRRTRHMLGNSSPSLEAVDLKRVVERVTKLLRDGGTCLDVPVKTRIDSKANILTADPVQVEQVLMNLLRNACSALRQNPSPEIRISSNPSSDRTMVRIQVRDNGIGLPVDPRLIFDSHHGSTTGGLGVGLSICRTIVEAHGGKIWAKNNDDRGASFSFTMPANGSPD